MKKSVCWIAFALLWSLGSARGQGSDTTLTRFTDKRSSLLSVAGSLSVVGATGVSTTTTSLNLGVNYLRFVTTGFAPGLDVNLAMISGGGGSATLGLGPKLIFATGIHDAQVYPFLGFGYNLITNGSTGSNKGIGHRIKGSVGVIFEVADHLGIPVEFTAAIPLGEVANFKTYGLSIGIVVLGY